MNYFVAEVNGTCVEDITWIDKDGNPIFTNYVNMTYDEMKSAENLVEFVLANMESAVTEFGDSADQLILTLVDENDIFVWSIMMGIVDDELRYALVDWKKDGKNYRYTPS
jgi:hypothetical protein